MTIDELAAGLYASRWEDAAPRERGYLEGLALCAADREVVTGAMVARRLGKSPKQVSYLRARLILKGLIFADGSAVRFAVPGMAAWIRDDDPDVRM